MISSAVGVDTADGDVPTATKLKRKKVGVKSLSGGSKTAREKTIMAKKVKIPSDREPDYVLDLSQSGSGGNKRKKMKGSRQDSNDDNHEEDGAVDNRARRLLEAHPEQDTDCPFDALVFFGDLNYRLDLPRLELELLKERMHRVGGEDEDGDESRAVEADLRAALEYDQLTREKCRGRAFRGFKEGRIGFAPTFKYDRGSDQFDSSGKGRAPAWTDRVLFKNAVRSKTTDGTSKGVSTGESLSPLLTLLEYNSVDNRHSDHRPVYSKFNLCLL